MELNLLGYKINLEVLILMALIYLIMLGHTLWGCSCGSSRMEGFTSLDNSAKYTLGDNTQVDTSSWMMANLTNQPGQAKSKGAQDILNRPAQPVPLPEGEMVMFATTEFKPECCPNTYSTGSGCACMTVNQYNHLVSRGGNNVPYSEY